MTEKPAAILERLLRANQLAWMIDMFGPPERAVSSLLEQLHQVEAVYGERTQSPIPFTPEALSAETQANPHKVRAFLQALATSRSADMLVMVWRVLEGLRIRSVRMDYREQDYFRLVVVLAWERDGRDIEEEYRSSDINDAALVRHFGITTIDGRPLFEGFFPLRTK